MIDKKEFVLQKTGDVGNRKFNNFIEVCGYKLQINKDGLVKVNDKVKQVLLATGKFTEVKNDSPKFEIINK